MILQEKSAVKWKFQIYHTIISSILWGLGYIGFWSMKWVLASVISKENIILDAVKDIIYRSGNTNLVGENISFFDVIMKNLEPLDHLPFILLIIVTVALIIAKNTMSFRKIKGYYAIPYLLVMLYPFAWYFFTKNHSFIHNHFTYRELSISIFALCSSLNTTINPATNK